MFNVDFLVSKECNTFQDSDMKRSPHLVPYSKVDDAIKKANRYVLNGRCGICVFLVYSMALTYSVLISSQYFHSKI